MRVAIVGGTGFIGSYLSEAILARGHQPVLLVRPGSETRVIRPQDCDVIIGDAESASDRNRLLKGCDAAIYNVGILREHRRRGITFDRLQHHAAAAFAQAAAANGVRRFLLMSANGVKETGTAYQVSKHRAEVAALDLGLDVTVFRPSVVFGDPRGRMEFATQLLRDMVRPPVPAVGFFNAFGERRGQIRMSPVHVRDVADAFAAALDDPGTVGKTIVLAGPDSLTWQEMLRRIATVVGRSKWVLPMPVELMKLAAALLDWLPAFPVTRDQLTMLAESNVGDPAPITQLIGREPRPFDAAALTYLAS